MGVAWRATHSRQAVHSRKTQKTVYEHEPPGGPSTPPGGFWKFLEKRRKAVNHQFTHFIQSRKARTTYT